MSTVLVAAPTTTARTRLVALLASRKTLQVVLGPPGLSLNAQIDAVDPDVLLVDLGPAPSRAELRAIVRRARPPAIVALADGVRGALEAFRAGGLALLPRQATTEEIGAAIEAAIAGLLVFHTDTLDALRPSPSADDRAAPPPQPLTPREIEVLGMMAEGLGNKVIAARLAISAHTVKFHVAAILAKLDAESRTEAVTVGLRRGLIMI